MAKILVLAGCIFGVLGVIIGAFGAHALKGMLEATGRLETFETAVKYQFYHALALILLGMLFQKNEGIILNLSGWMFVGGILFFSGSLYILSLTGIKAMGAVAPIGGLAFIIGWICMAIGIGKNW